MLIMANAILMGMKDYLDKDNTRSEVNKFIVKSDAYFNFFIYLEFVLKAIGMGLSMNDNGYFGDSWNWLDAFVVVTSAINDITPLILGDTQGGGGMKALRSVRLMRPLKLLRGIPSIRLLISTLLASVGSLGGIMTVAMFFFLIFAILGVTLWKGKIHYRCYLTEFPVDGEWELLPDYYQLCGSNNQCPSGSFCGSRFVEFEKGTRFNDPDLWVDTNIEELNYGINNFDNIGSAFITIFQCTTLDGWSNIMQFHDDIFSSVFVSVYFVMVIVICDFFVLNMTIALMLLKYETVQEDITKDASHDSEDRDMFSRELHQLGEFIFPEKHHDLVDFIVDTDGVTINKAAFKHLKAKSGFIKSFFEGEKFNLNRETDPYYKKPQVVACLKIIEHDYFPGTIMIVIILNTICLSLDSYPDPPEM